MADERINTPEEEEEIQVLTLTDAETGEDIDFELLLQMDIEGTTYVALIPVGANEDEGYALMKIAEEDGEEVLVTIDDDDEFDAIADIFDDELGFNEVDHD